MECLGVNIKEKKKKTMWLWQTFRTWANQSLLCCTALGSGYLRDKLRGRKLTPPRFGKHSACPPTVGRSLLWSLLHHPWQDPERYMKGTKSFKGVDDQYGKEKTKQNQTSPATWETNVYLELHGADLIQDLPHVFPDDGPGDFVVTLSCGLHRMSGHVIKRYHVWEDANSFVEGAKPKRIFTHMLFNTFSCFHGNYSNIIKYNIQNAQLQESACSFKTFNVICLNVSALYSPVIGSITILLQVVVLNELSNF